LLVLRNLDWWRFGWLWRGFKFFQLLFESCLLFLEALDLFLEEFFSVRKLLPHFFVALRVNSIEEWCDLAISVE